MKIRYPFVCWPLLLLFLGGCAFSPDPAPAPAPAGTASWITHSEFDEVRRADEWHYRQPEGDWPVVHEIRRQNRAFVERRPTEEDAGAPRLVEEAWFGDEPEARLAALLEERRAALEASGAPFRWEILSQRPDDVVVEWSGPSREARGAERFEIRRFKVGRHGLYGLALAAAPESVSSQAREQWRRTVRDARLEPYAPKTFRLVVENYEISDPEIVESLHAQWTEAGEGSHRPREAMQPEVEAVISEMSPVFRETFLMDEREQFAFGGEDMTYHLQTGFYEVHPAAAWIWVDCTSGEVQSPHRQDEPQLPRARNPYEGDGSLFFEDFFPETPFTTGEIPARRTSWGQWAGLAPLGEPRLAWEFEERRSGRPTVVRVTRMTVEIAE